MSRFDRLDPSTAELDDPSQIALGDAVVDDRGVDSGQVQRRECADQLKPRDDREQRAIRSRIPPQQRPEHPVTVAHHP